MSRRKRSPEEQEKKKKIRELVQISEISSFLLCLAYHYLTGKKDTP